MIKTIYFNTLLEVLFSHFVNRLVLVFFLLLNFSKRKYVLNSLKTNNFKQNLTKIPRKFIIFADLNFNSRNRDIMKKFTEYKQLNLNAVAENVANFWKTNQTFKNP